MAGKTIDSLNTTARGTRVARDARVTGVARDGRVTATARALPKSTAKTPVAPASQPPAGKAVLNGARPDGAKKGRGKKPASAEAATAETEAALAPPLEPGAVSAPLSPGAVSSPLLDPGAVSAPLLSPGAVSAPLLSWYDRHRRVLPWRALPGETPDPYKVWLSEIMLQQTTVAAVGPYFQAFLARWPTVRDLAAAPIEELLAAWAGLGYYARARNLHKCAEAVVRDHGGRFPGTEESLRALPGIGAYTAGAIAAIAFDRKASAVDGNVERVVARLFAVATPLPNAKPALRALAADLVPDARAGDFAQAMMDLGATICTPRKPACVLCPLNDGCAARRRGLAADLPARGPKKPRPLRKALAFWIEREGEGGEIEVLLRRRPPKGMLGGMLEIPGTDWSQDAAAHDKAARDQSPMRARCWHVLPGIVRHGFTHFELETTVLTARVAKNAQAPDGAIWSPRATLDTAGLPTVMWKVVKRAAERG